MLNRKYSTLRVDRKLTMGKGAKIMATNAAGTETEVDMTELATLGGVTASAAELNIMDGVLATTAEINRASDVSTRLVLAGATLAVTELAHDGKTILLDQLAGSVCTLPASSGSGARFRFVIHTVPTSNSHIVKVANSTDVMSGVIIEANDTDASSSTWETAATSDTITLNRTTTGGTIKGEWIEVEDIAAGFWAVRGVIAGTGAEATPFSATV
jgi:hypothetical protein